MKVLIYGSGAVGIAIAAALYDSGCQVDLKTSIQTKKAIDKVGIIRRGILREINVKAGSVTTYNKLSEISNKKYDFILVCTKTISNIENAKELSENTQILKPQGKIVLFQNGWGNDEPYLKFFSKDKIYSARIITGFERPELHISVVTVHAAPLLIGSLHNENLEAVIQLATLIDLGGMPCEITTELGQAIWAKMLYNCTLNPLGAILNVSYGKLTKSKNSVFLMDNIIEEIFKVMRAAGFSSYWNNADDYKDEFYSKLLPVTYEHRSSTLQDIEKKMKTEIDSLTGSILRLGLKYNISVPYNTMVYNLIKAMESYF